MIRRHVQAVMLSAAVALLGVFVVSAQVMGLAVPPKPSDVPIVDQTNTLTAEQKKTIADIIAAERNATGNQIAVLMVSSLEDDALEDYSLRVAREWGIGSKDRNNGVFLFIAKDDRKLRIEVGYGLEGALTDIRSNQIIRDRIRPSFQKDDYYGGIQSGVEGIAAAINGEVDPNLSSTTDNSEGYFPWEMVLFFGLIGFSWLGSMLARTKSWWAGGVIGGVIGAMILFFASVIVGVFMIIALTVIGLLFDRAVSANYRSHARHGDAPSWWAGGPFIGGGGSGGGFGGFGGGSFGGGGSSGSW